MQTTLLYIHVAVGLLFILSVLVQDKGTGFGTALGGSSGGGFYASQRGAAKILHRISIVLGTLFLATAVAYVVVPADEPQEPTGATVLDENGAPLPGVVEAEPAQ